MKGAGRGASVIAVEMSAPYLGLDHLVSAMAEAVVRADRNVEELQNPEEMVAAAALTWESHLRELAEKRAIKGHNWDTLAAEDWVYLNIERDVFFVDDLNACEELTRVGFLFMVVRDSEEAAREFADIEEVIYNPAPIKWGYWMLKMSTLTPGEAARLMAGLDPDIYGDLSVDPLKNDTSSARKRAVDMERLALREGRPDRDSAFNWLVWAKEQGFEVHRGYSRFANARKEYEDAQEALRALPEKEAGYWRDAGELQNGRREITSDFAGSRSTRQFTLPQFVSDVSERLARWGDGRYALIEAAQVLADSEATVDPTGLCEQMEQAIRDGKLVLRKNDVPMSKGSIPRGRLWNRFVRADDVNEWLASCNAGYRLAYPYETETASENRPVHRVSDQGWKEIARERAVAFIREQRARDLYPSQEDVADYVAKGFRQQNIVGADGKPLSGATIKRHALKGISSAVGKQLSTAVSRGK